MFCHKCGKKIPDDKKFCLSCGTPVREKGADTPSKTASFCAKCGEPVRSGAGFCASCGTPSRTITGQTQPVAQPAPVAAARKKRSAKEFFASTAGAVAIVLIALLVTGGVVGVVLGTRGSGGIDLGAAYAKSPEPETFIQTETWGEIPANQVCVLMKEGKGKKDAELLAKELGGSIVGEIEYTSCYQIETKSKTEEELRADLEKAGKAQGVEAVFPNAQVFPRDAINGKQVTPLNETWYVETNADTNDLNNFPCEIIGLQDGWDMFMGARALSIDGSALVGILDEPLSSRSDDYELCPKDGRPASGRARVVGLEERFETNDVTTHGTKVAHVFFASPEYGGAAGVAGPIGEKLDVRSINMYRNPGTTEVNLEFVPDPSDPTIVQWHDGKSYIYNALVDMITMVENGVEVINNSWGPAVSPDARPFAIACRRTYEKLAGDPRTNKVLIVFATSNTYTDGIDGYNDMSGYKLPNLITVGGIDNSGNRWRYSPYVDPNTLRLVEPGCAYATGEGEITLAAPAVKLFLGVDGNGNAIKATGCSLAAPQVAGTAALIKSINPRLTAEQVKDMIVNSGATSVTRDGRTVNIASNIGGKVLRVDNAVYEAVKSTGADVDRDALLKLGRVNLKAEGGPEEYEVTAGVEAIGDEPVVLEIELQGDGYIGGLSKQTLKEPGQVTWKVNKRNEGEPLVLKVTRSDSGAASKIVQTLSLKAQELSSEQFKVAASVVDVPEKGGVKLQLQAAGGSVAGSAEQSLASDGEVAWDIVRPSAANSVVLTVTRLDTGETATLELESSRDNKEPEESPETSTPDSRGTAPEPEDDFPETTVHPEDGEPEAPADQTYRNAIYFHGYDAEGHTYALGGIMFEYGKVGGSWKVVKWNWTEGEGYPLPKGPREAKEKLRQAFLEGQPTGKEAWNRATSEGLIGPGVPFPGGWMDRDDIRVDSCSN